MYCFRIKDSVTSKYSAKSHPRKFRYEVRVYILHVAQHVVLPNGWPFLHAVQQYHMDCLSCEVVPVIICPAS